MAVKRILLFSIFAITYLATAQSLCNAQNFDPTSYYSVSKGDSLFRNHNYGDAILYYLTSLNQGVKPKRDIYYAISLGYDHLEEDSLAGVYMKLAVQSGLAFYNVQAFQADQKLKAILLQSENGEDAIGVLKANTIRSEHSDSLCSNPDIRDELLRRKKLDQKYRKVKTRANYRQLQHELDLDNQAYLEGVLEELGGWPGYAQVGRSGHSAAAMIAIHSSDTLFQRRALSLMEDELDRANISCNNYALLYDKLTMAREDQQIFGTQVFYDGETKKAIPHPLKYPEIVDSLRELFECVPLKDYLEHMSR